MTENYIHLALPKSMSLEDCKNALGPLACNCRVDGASSEGIICSQPTSFAGVELSLTNEIDIYKNSNPDYYSGFIRFEYKHAWEPFVITLIVQLARHWTGSWQGTFLGISDCEEVIFHCSGSNITCNTRFLPRLPIALLPYFSSASIIKMPKFDPRKLPIFESM